MYKILDTSKWSYIIKSIDDTWITLYVLNSFYFWACYQIKDLKEKWYKIRNPKNVFEYIKIYFNELKYRKI